MKFYKCGKKIITDDNLKKTVCPILGITIDELEAAGILSETKPTVEDCVRFGSVGMAVVLHQTLYNSDIKTAIDAVEKIKNDLKET